MPRPLSFQLYSARELPIAATISLLAKLGFSEVEGFDGVYRDSAGLRALLNRHGMTMPTGHFGLHMLEADRAGVLRTASALGIRHIFAPYLAEADRPSSAVGWTRFGERLAAVGEWLHAEGFGFGWHNHDFEFARVATGEAPLDLIFAAAPDIDWEIDVAWIARCGEDSLAWIGKHGRRIAAVHVKDLARPGENTDEDGWADVGQGTVEWPSILTALRDTPARHFVAEHDHPSDVERFAGNSIGYLNGLKGQR